MITNKGRVIYDRKKNYFKPKEIARILDSYSTDASGSDFGKFVWNILDIMLKRQSRRKGFKIDFYEAILFQELKKGEFDPEALLMQFLTELWGAVPQIIKQPVESFVKAETSAERKRRIVEERR